MRLPSWVPLSVLHLVTTTRPAFGAQSNLSLTPCYYVNGDPATDHQPCFPSALSAPGGESACCLFSNGDVCLDSGLCLNGVGLAYQGACTDREWRDSACPHRCPDPQDNWQGINSRPRYWNVLMCDSGIYCCRQEADTSNCCNDTASLSTVSTPLGMPTTVAAVISTAGTGTGSAAVMTSGSTAAETASGGASNPTCVSARETGLCSTGSSSKTVAVGVGVGVSLGTLLVASLVALGFVLSRRKEPLFRGGATEPGGQGGGKYESKLEGTS